MFLKSIKLTNVKCLEEVELSFTGEQGSIRKHTLLLGENGTGKSNILKAIALITAGSDAMYDLLPQPEEWIQYEKEHCEIEAVLTTKSNEERHLKIRIEKGDTLRAVVEKNSSTLVEIDNALDHSDINYFLMGYGASRRLNPERSLQGNESSFRGNRAKRVSTLFNRDAALNPLESWAMDMDYREGDEGLIIVKDSLNEFLPDIRFSHIDKERKKLLFKTKDGLIPLEGLSDGYQNVAAWVGDMLWQITKTFQHYKSPLQARGVLLLDEIDLHLHPNWQRRLLRFIEEKLPNFQLIATTHSPMTAQQAGFGELYYLSREGKRVALQEFNGTPKHLLIHQLLMTDAFGLGTDESLELEELKGEYRSLRDRGDLNSEEKERLEEISRQLSDLPKCKPSNVLFGDDQMLLLEQVKNELLKNNT